MTIRPKADVTTIVENRRVIVKRWHFAPNAETGSYRIDLDAVIVFLTDATLVSFDKQGPLQFDFVSGHTYYLPAGVEHGLVNVGPRDVVFISVDLKNDASGEHEKL